VKDKIVDKIVGVVVAFFFGLIILLDFLFYPFVWGWRKIKSSLMS
jgi:hypothetical protein